ADDRVLLGQELADVAVAGGGQARKERLLLEVEMPADLAVERGQRLARQRFGLGAGQGERALHPPPEGDHRVVLLVEAAADLAAEIHGGDPFSIATWDAGRARARPCLASAAP